MSYLRSQVYEERLERGSSREALAAQEDEPCCPCCKTLVSKESFHSHVCSCFMGRSQSKSSRAGDGFADIASTIDSIRSHVNKIDLHKRISMVQSLGRLAIATKPRKQCAHSVQHNMASGLKLNMTNFDNQMLAMLFTEPKKQSVKPNKIDTNVGPPKNNILAASPLLESALDEGLFTEANEEEELVLQNFGIEYDKDFYEPSSFRESTTPPMSSLGDPVCFESVGRGLKRGMDSDLYKDLDTLYDVMENRAFKLQKVL